MRRRLDCAVLLFVSGLCLSLGADVSAEGLGRVNLTGSDLSAWRGRTGQWQVVGEAFADPEDEKLLKTRPGTGVMVNGPTGRTVNILTEQEFGDIRAHIEFVVPKDSNSGVYLMGRYEIQVFDSWKKPSAYPGIECGGIYERWDESRNPKGYEGYSPLVNASRPPGQWQTFDVVFRAPRFEKGGLKVANARITVVHNGVVIHDNLELTGPTRAGEYGDEKSTGPLMIQGDHGPVAYRNVWIEPVGALRLFALDNAVSDERHQTAKQQAETLAELGCAGIGVGYKDPAALREMLRELDERGLRLFTVYFGIDIEAEGAGRYPATLPEAIEVLKGRNTILWVFARSEKIERSSPDGDGSAVEIVGEIAEMADKAGLRVSLYPHHAFWLERVEDAVRIAKRVDRKNVGVTFNLCHWLRVSGPGPVEPVLREAMPYLSVVTINGADTDGKDWKQLIQTLDRGSYDVGAFLRTLSKCGYNGPVGLQAYGIGGDAHENLSRSMKAWRRYAK